MGTKRGTVLNKLVNYYDGQQITEDELQDDQNRHFNSDAANVLNLMGSGIVKIDPLPNVIFDSDDLNTQQQSLFDGYSFDGQNIYTGTPLAELSDTVEGVQLSVELQNVELKGLATSKVLIIGDNFNGDLIHDDLEFYDNNVKVTQGRYKSIRAIMFNDFFGNLNDSKKLALDDGYNKIGRCIIKESGSFQASKDTVIANQILEPSQFFNEFKPFSSSYTLNLLLTQTIGSDKSIDDMNFGLNSVATRTLSPNDVTTKIGQKFLMTGDNIQKLTLLLSTEYDATALAGEEYDWSGDVVLTIHELQTSVSCPVDTTPDNAVDFDPNPAIIGQVVLSAEDMAKQGVVLDGYAKKVDFVFTGTSLSDPLRSGLTENQYYVFTINRSGDAHTGTIVIEEATSTYENGYMTVFDGSQWINVTNRDMWFDLHGDFIKVSDGIMYEDGVGLEIPKVKEDETNTEVPYIEGDIPFYTVAYDAYNYIVVERSDDFSDSEQDQRTGNSVFSRVTPVPEISLISESSFSSLLSTNPNPSTIAMVRDMNPRGNPGTITGSNDVIGLMKKDRLEIPSPNSDITNFNWEGSILQPNTLNSNKYRIASVTTVTDSYGDINGDGEIDLTDVDIISTWLGKWGPYTTPINRLTLSDGYVQQLIADEELDIVQFLRADVNGDGYVDAADQSVISNYINGTVSTFTSGSSFTRTTMVLESLSDPANNTIDTWASDGSLNAVSYSSINWSIEYFATWNPDLIVFEDTRRFISTTFTEESTTTEPGGFNDFYIPRDLLIEGDIKRPDGTFYPVDFEVNHLSLQIPALDSGGSPTELDGYSGILLFDNFVAESSNGKTSAGLDAMKYSDGTYVQITDFSEGKIKITASLQSIGNEWTVGSTVEDIIGMYYDPSTSLLTLKIKEIKDDSSGNVYPPEGVRILVTVYMKQGGFKNDVINVSDSKMRSILGI